MRKLPVLGMFAASLAVVSPAHASDLVYLVDQPVEQMMIARSFVATASTTLIVFGGYQIPSFVRATDISVTAMGSSVDLLQPTFDFTAAPAGSWADQAIAPGVVGLEFGGTVAGSYDLFSQSFATTVGTTYDLGFLYSQEYAGFNGLKVTVDETLAQVIGESTTPVPEPSAWAMMLAGFAMIGMALRRRRRSAPGQSGRI